MQPNSPATHPTPVEARLTKTPLSVRCELVDEQEQITPLQVVSRHMRGAKQETTAVLRERGYSPRGRWEPGESDHYSARVFALDNA